MDKDAKIYVAGHTGLVGSSITRCLKKQGYENLVYTPFPGIDLRVQEECNRFFEKEKPEYVILAAAKVGGIVANNTYPAEFIYENLMIECNVIHAAHIHKVKKLLFLGSSCIYPKLCHQPIREEYLLTGSLEETNEAYALAKIAGLKMCSFYRKQYGDDYISAMPTNLYGPNDNFDLEKSHVLPAMIRKFHLAKCLENNDWQSIQNDLNKRPVECVDGTKDEKAVLSILEKYGIKKTGNSVFIELWGTGSPLRELLHVDDLAAALVFLLLNYSGEEHVNIGTGIDQSIADLAMIVKNTVGFNGKISWNSEKPDGTPRKLLDVSKITALGWQAEIQLKSGIERTYNEYISE
ncbi:MAG: GDP-L-fucose synthase [Bacteroidota bacterium]